MKISNGALKVNGFRYLIGSRDFTDYVLSVQTGTSIPHVSGSQLEAFRFRRPPLDKQQAIGRTLETLDKKIDVNRDTSLTLYALARALFKSWFVDFDPVVASATGRRPFGIDAETLAVFPNTFVDSELGPIPGGWRIGSIAELADYVNGRNFTKDATGRGRMVIRIAELNSGPGPSTVYTDVESPSEHVAIPGDLLFAWSGSLGVYLWAGDPALVNQHIFKVVCSRFPRWFVFHQLTQAINFFVEIAAGKATTMGHINRAHLTQARIVIPRAEVLEAASRALDPLLEGIVRNEQESQRLAAVRDFLLPRLLSGEIRIKDAEDAAAEALA